MLTIVAAAAVRDAIFRKCRFFLTSCRPAACKCRSLLRSWPPVSRKCRPRLAIAPRSRHIIFRGATVRSRSRPRGGTSLACPHAAAGPRLRRDLSQVPLAGSSAIQHRRRRLRPLGGARTGQARDRRGRCRRHGARCQLRLAARHLEPARQCACGARHRAAATASRSCCRRRPRSPRSTSRSTSSAPSRCRSRCCSAPRRSPIACRTPAPRR